MMPKGLQNYTKFATYFFYKRVNRHHRHHNHRHHNHRHHHREMMMAFHQSSPSQQSIDLKVQFPVRIFQELSGVGPSFKYYDIPRHFKMRVSLLKHSSKTHSSHPNDPIYGSRLSMSLREAPT